ncbi:ABC transporter permease [Clostridia bacterium]|nr:ABC transporter permease [Clostridia bacterium]
MKIRRILTVARKEVIHIKRDKPSLIISFMMPIMMLLIFGFAVNTDVNNVDFAVLDSSRTALSRELIASFSKSYYFREYAFVESVEELEYMIQAGEIKVGMVIPSDFSRNLKRRAASQIQILVDGSDPTIARTAASYAMAVTNAYSAEFQLTQIEKSGIKPSTASVTAAPMILYNPTLESAKFNVPGVVGLILQNITIILTALAMVREKELGTIEQLIMTPVTATELIIGKLIPYIAIGCYDFAVVMILSYLIFGVSVAGNILELILLGFIFLVGALATGMLISTVARNQAQAIQGALAFLLPSVLLSGFMFPRESMPIFIQWLSALFPITHFLVILRGIIVKGVNISYLMGSTVAMLLLIVITIGAAAAKFSKKLD